MSDLVIIVLATWYVSYVLTSSHGPGGIFEWIREHVWHGRTKRASINPDMHGWPEGKPIPLDMPKWVYTFDKNGLLDCPICLAFWAALVLLIMPMGIVTQALAVAGAAMILHGFSGWRYARD